MVVPKSTLSVFLSLVQIVALIFATTSCVKKKTKKNDEAQSDKAKCDAATDPMCNSKLQPIQKNQASLLQFEDDATYKNYIAAIIKKNIDGFEKVYGDQAADSAELNAIVTNTQESGVDEGGIVKNIGDHLIVLRKGKLFAANIKNPGKPSQTDVINVAATKALYENVWYDEMLVYEKNIVVLGFRYVVPGVDVNASPPSTVAPPSQLTSGATEIHTFVLESGKFVRGKSLFIESTDYFSSSNYSSRMVGSSLLFYLPEKAVRNISGTPEPTLPKYLNFTETGTIGSFSFGEPVLSAQEIHRPIELPTTPILHMILKCNLENPLNTKCSARAVLGDDGQHFYASKENVFIWSYPWVYSMPMDSLIPKVFRIKGFGEPISHMGFKQSEGFLDVIVKDIRSPKGSIYDEPPNVYDSSNAEPQIESPTSDAIPGSEGIGPDSRVQQYENLVSVLSLPLKDFNGTGEQTLTESEITKVHSGFGVTQTGNPRVVGNTFYIPFSVFEPDSSGSSVTYSEMNNPKNEGISHIATFNMATKATKVSVWNGAISRIESVGTNSALVVDGGDTTPGNVNSKQGLRLSTLKNGENFSPISQVSLAGAIEGESRTHAYFYKESTHDSGILGLAVVNSSPERTNWFGDGISNLAFIAKDSQNKLRIVGTVSSQGSFSDTCASSCIDWYGNSRPIFIGNRIFTLQGSELGEVSVGEKTARIGAALLMK